MLTKPKEKTAGEQHVESLHAKYEKLAAEVPAHAPNTPERYDAMEAKKEAFLQYNRAKDANDAAELAAADAEQKKSAAEGATREADAAKKHAADVARAPEKLTAPAAQPTPRPVGKET